MMMISTSDRKKCSLCDEMAWYITGEPVKKAPFIFFCANHRPEAYARQRGIWGYDSKPREEDRLLTEIKIRDIIFPTPNNLIPTEESQDA